MATITRSNLTHLDLSGNNLPLDVIFRFGEILKHSLLRSLRLSPSHSLPIRVLNSTKFKRSVSFSRLGLGSEDVAFIAGCLGTNTTITALDLSGNRLTTPQQYLFNPRSFNLANVDSERTTPKWKAEQLVPKPSSLFHSSLEAALTHSKPDSLLPPLPSMSRGIRPGTDQHGMELMARALACNTTLRFLDLGGSGVDAMGARHLAHALLFNTTLETLVLDEVPLPVRKVRRSRTASYDSLP